MYDHERLVDKFNERGYNIYERFEKAGIDYQAFIDEGKALKRREVLKHITISTGLLTVLPITPLFFLPTFAILISMFFIVPGVLYATLCYDVSAGIRIKRAKGSVLSDKIFQAIEKFNSSTIGKALLHPEFQNLKIVDYLNPKPEQIQEDQTQEESVIITLDQVFNKRGSKRYA